METEHLIKVFVQKQPRAAPTVIKTEPSAYPSFIMMYPLEIVLIPIVVAIIENTVVKMLPLENPAPHQINELHTTFCL